MSLTAQDKAGISQNLGNCLLSSVQHIEKLDPNGQKSNSQGLLAKQMAVLTIAICSIGQLLVAQAEESRVIMPS